MPPRSMPSQVFAGRSTRYPTRTPVRGQGNSPDFFEGISTSQRAANRPNQRALLGTRRRAHAIERRAVELHVGPDIVAVDMEVQEGVRLDVEGPGLTLGQ